MWFKNLRIYRLTEKVTLSAEEINNQLAERETRECGALESSSYGWERPLGRRGQMHVHVVGDCIMICARRVEKVLPAGVVNEAVQERAEALEEAEARVVRRRERLEIKDQVMMELLPRAFVQSSCTFAYLDTRNDWLVVDAASAKRAEELVEMLRETLGSLRTTPLTSARAPASVMTAWLSGGQEPMGPFALLDECELRDTSDEGAVVRCRHQDLTSEEIGSHLAAGKQAVQLGLVWDERLEFVLGEDLAVKRLRFGDRILEDAADAEAEEPAARFDTDFALMSGELAQFLPALVEAFGGLEGEAGANPG